MPGRFLRFVAAGLLAASAVYGGDLGRETDLDSRLSALKGVHYAVSRNSLHPETWEEELHHTSDCMEPCRVEFDERLSAVHLRYKWKQLNPEKGVYDFSDLGDVLDDVHESGKLATLVVMGGKYTPDWVFEEGTPHIDLRASHVGAYAQPLIPAPWDPVYVDAYNELVAELADFLRETPTRYHTIALVKNGAIVVHSGETRMMPFQAFLQPSKRHDKDFIESFQRELCENWARIGFSEEDLLAAAVSTRTQLDRSFPDKLIGLAFVSGLNRFPTVGKTGACTYPETNKTLNQIIMGMVAEYGRRAVIINTVLTEDTGQPRILNWVKKNGGTIGFQIEASKIGCRKPQSPCDPVAFEKAMWAGVDAGALLIEVHDGNIHRFKGLLTAVNAEMAGP